jgi:hypothetical protein
MSEQKIAPGVYHIPVNGELHKKLISEFKFRMRMARDAQRDTREKAWKKAEDTFMAYVPETELDATRKKARDAGQPAYTTLAIPYSYAMLLTSHTYYTSVFLSRNPVMQMTGRHGESQNAETMVESLLDYQLQTGGGMPALFVWLLDVGKYGYGVLGHYWDKEVIPTTEYVEVNETFMGMPIPGKMKKELVTKESVGYVGNRLYNIRPQDAYFDPRYPIHRFQDGEFVIVFDRVGYNKILKGRADGRYYNTKAIPKKARGDSDRDMGSHLVKLPGETMSMSDGDADGKTPAFVDLHEFYWEISPAELGLGSSRRPEKWVFTIAAEEVCISAMPLGLLHGKFPFDVIPYEVDGYSQFPRSMLEILEPTNTTMEWLLNSHFFNVRSALNNMFIGDPSRVNMKDVENPEPGKFIRLKPAAYGQDVRSMMAQFPVQDITRSNLNDMTLMGDLAQRVGGVSDNVMGMINPGGRRTATEVRTSSSFSANRLKTACEWFSTVGWAPLAQKMLQSTQQLYDTERKYRIVGDLAQWGERYLNVSPNDVQGFYDFVPVDGTMPVDRYAQANLWNQMFQTMSKMPQVMMQYDMAKLFGFVAQLAGLKNVTSFRIQVQPDAVLQQQAQKGNMVSMRMNSNEPGQIPGMGATG